MVFNDIRGRLDINDVMIESFFKVSSLRVSNVRRLKRRDTIHMDKLVYKNEDEESKKSNHVSFS